MYQSKLLYVYYNPNNSIISPVNALLMYFILFPESYGGSVFFPGFSDNDMYKNVIGDSIKSIKLPHILRQD